MKTWNIFFKVLIFIIGVAAIAFDGLLYNSYEKQKTENLGFNKEQQVYDKRFKYEQEQIEGISRDLQAALQQIKDQSDSLADQKEALATQKDALFQEIEKRQQIADENKNIQSSLVDARAEADAIKQDVKGWQKDYVTVLADLGKKADDSQAEIKSLQDKLAALNIPELKNSIDSLKADVEKISAPPKAPSQSQGSIKAKNEDQH
jgi:chromosome segregation ATPase